MISFLLKLIQNCSKPLSREVKTFEILFFRCHIWQHKTFSPESIIKQYVCILSSCLNESSIACKFNPNQQFTGYDHMPDFAYSNIMHVCLQWLQQFLIYIILIKHERKFFVEDFFIYFIYIFDHFLVFRYIFKYILSNV